MDPVEGRLGWIQQKLGLLDEYIDELWDADHASTVTRFFESSGSQRYVRDYFMPHEVLIFPHFGASKTRK
jgi:hypothetical protein